MLGSRLLVPLLLVPTPGQSLAICPANVLRQRKQPSCFLKKSRSASESGSKSFCEVAFELEEVAGLLPEEDDFVLQLPERPVPAERALFWLRDTPCCAASEGGAALTRL